MPFVNDLDRNLAAKWGFVPSIELPSGHCSRVYASADRVLKVPFQGEEMFSGRVAAELLSRMVGPRVFESDEATGALLMERLVPGTNLAESGLTENERLVVFSELAMGVRGSMRREDPDSSGLGRSFDGLMPLAEFMANSLCPFVPDLLKTSPESVFLHGDLHHMNILLHGENWLAIDPKGLYGDPAFEAAAYIRNPISSIGDAIDLPRLLTGRIEFSSKLMNVDPKRIWAWSLAELWDEDEYGEEAWGKVKAALLELANLHH